MTCNVIGSICMNAHVHTHVMHTHTRTQSPQLSTSLCSVPAWVFTFYETVNHLLLYYSTSILDVTIWLLYSWQDYLREILMREQQLKTFIQEKVSALPEDIQSKHFPYCHYISAYMYMKCHSMYNYITHSTLPTGLSYWLARRLPINDQSKLELLSYHCPTQRLIRGLQILKVTCNYM